MSELDGKCEGEPNTSEHQGAQNSEILFEQVWDTFSEERRREIVERIAALLYQLTQERQLTMENPDHGHE